MLRRTVGYAVGCVTLPIVLVLSTATRLVMSVARIAPLPLAHAFGRGDDFARWGDRATERLMELAGGPLLLTGWIIGSRRERPALGADCSAVQRSCVQSSSPVSANMTGLSRNALT